MQTVRNLVAGVEKAQNELDELKQLPLSSQDRFIPIIEVRRSRRYLEMQRLTALRMQQFVRHAKPAMKALQELSSTLEQELKDLLIFFGEDPSATRPEALFDLIAQFASMLQVRDHVQRGRCLALLNLA